MKKVLSFLCALAMLASLVSFAVAEEPVEITCPLPESWPDLS